MKSLDFALLFVELSYTIFACTAKLEQQHNLFLPRHI